MIEKEQLTIEDLAKAIENASPAFQYECELIRRMTLVPSCKTSREAQKYFHDDFSSPIVRILSRKPYVEALVKIQNDYHEYIEEVRCRYNAFIVEPDPNNGILYKVLLRYANYVSPESSSLPSFVTSCSIHYFINLFKKQVRRDKVGVRMTDEMMEKANGRSFQDDSRIILYKAVCPDDTLSDEEIIEYGDDLIQKIIECLPEKEKEVIRLTFFEGLAGIEAYDEMFPEEKNTDDNSDVRKRKQNYISHLRSRAIEHMIIIKNKLYHE